MPLRRRAPAIALISSLCALAGTGAAAADDDITYRRTVVANGMEGGVVVDLPVSEEMTYLDGTASYPEYLVFSLDGGRRFAPLGELRVLDPEGVRPATAADVTDLRWRLPARPGQRIDVSYRAAAR